MLEIVIGFFVNFLEKLGFGWWKKYEDEEANNAANNVDALSKPDLDKLHDKWIRK